MWEIVRFCRAQGILCQGRGSAANSAVCYCLGITRSIRCAMGLLFERFLSRERAEPPDIDLDIEHERREEVIQYVYAKYGRTHAAMVANVIRYRARSAVRDVGKALGIPETALDRRLEAPLGVRRRGPGGVRAGGARPGAAGASPHDPARRRGAGLPAAPVDPSRAGSCSGTSRCRDLVPIENGSMPDRTVIQWDKDVARGARAVQGRPARARRAEPAPPGLRPPGAALRSEALTWRRSRGTTPRPTT